MERITVRLSLLFAGVFGLLIGVACATHTGDGTGTPEKAFRRNEQLFASTLDRLFSRYRDFRRPGRETSEVHVYDFDHTLADTRTLIPLRPLSGPTRYSDSKCFEFQKGDTPDFEVFTEKDLMATAPISVTLERLKKLKNRREALVFVVTARSQEHTFLSTHRYLTNRGARVDGVLALNSDFLMQHLWAPLKDQNIPSHLRKALLIAALVDSARRAGATVKLVRYHEDTDRYTRGFLELMPSFLPAGRAETFDYIRKKGPGGLVYTEVLVAYTEHGRVHSPDGTAFAGVEEYDSGDCPLR